jgi:preprotein translocase subunit SecD
MKRDLNWRIILIIVVLGLAVWAAFPLKEKINLGLDLQGGIHLILGVEADKAVDSFASRVLDTIKSDFRKERVRYTVLAKDQKNNIIIGPESEGDIAKIEKIMGQYPLRNISRNAQGEMIYSFPESQIKKIKENAVEQALETIRNRIDQFGVNEPTLQRQGKDRILIQLPGIADPQRAISIIGRTALLEFKLVNDEYSLDKALKGDIPPGNEILYQKTTNEATGSVSERPYLLKKRALLTGEYLTNAEVRIDSRRFNEPYVFITFDKTGARLFRKITSENVKKRLAIILDNTVYSAPVIQETIPDGKAQISGMFTMKEAHDLALVLRSGALPAPVKILENRTVGPSLGRDSVRQGVNSMILGGILVIVFMLLYYRMSGSIADFALLLNLVLMAGALGYFHATLTLPGMAGIILTIGMAVDANVLIFERIREELRLGKTVRASVDSGFSKAFLTILDANVTTLIAAVFLFQFGTGPVKGFAVTLIIGIVASMFTAIFVSRVVFDFILNRIRIKKLSI